MSNPFHTRMPLRTDWRIRLRLWREWAKQHWRAWTAGLAILTVPAMAALLLAFDLTTDTSVPTLVADVRAAQQVEREKSSEGIYHVHRVIVEGADKPAFVAAATGAAVEAPRRVDEVETWQHDETALALVVSNATERSFEAYLSREHEEGLALHHFGPADREVPRTREAYDAAHDLASLYTDYTSLTRPDVPVLPADATFTELDARTNTARFVHEPAENITIESVVDLASKQVVEEIIYVTDANENRYEMTRISYLERNVVPAEQFEEIFDPTAFPYEVVSTT